MTKIPVSYLSHEYRGINLFGVFVWVPHSVTIDWAEISKA